jgi:hypothetical protein
MRVDGMLRGIFCGDRDPINRQPIAVGLDQKLEGAGKIFGQKRIRDARINGMLKAQNLS